MGGSAFKSEQVHYTNAEGLELKGQLYLRYATVFISKKLYFLYFFTVSKTLLICHIDEINLLCCFMYMRSWYNYSE
jgi:hypothetical protein